jgi:hypothetical protein
MISLSLAYFSWALSDYRHGWKRWIPRLVSVFAGLGAVFEGLDWLTVKHQAETAQVIAGMMGMFR